MSTKPVTEYYQHKYQDEILHKATIQSILDELNDMQRQVSESVTTTRGYPPTGTECNRPYLIYLVYLT